MEAKMAMKENNPVSGSSSSPRMYQQDEESPLPLRPYVPTGDPSHSSDDDDRLSHFSQKESERGEGEEQEDLCRFAPNETKQVNRWRILVLISLLILGTCLSVMTYILADHKSSDALETLYSKPGILAGIVAVLFVFMAAILQMYDTMVENRNRKIVNAATHSTALVNSLYPANVAQQLLAEQEEKTNKPRRRNSRMGLLGVDSSHNSEADNSNSGSEKPEYSPIATLFPETTILFADLVGFTSWSSVREPTQVFQLLETLYGAYDVIAKRRRVFKVETVGDCYVAVCGIPNPVEHHAVWMCNFARDCLLKTWKLVKELECVLGPDTGDLTMRIGLHSGPVTGGVLRGEKSRFQLFGDTMNTAARMEQNSRPSSVQLSEECAELVMQANKSSWVVQREDKIVAKGKGELTTYWLQIGKVTTGPSSDNDPQLEHTETNDEPSDLYDATPVYTLSANKMERLIKWNTDVLMHHLERVVVYRKITGSNKADGAPDQLFLERLAVSPDEKSLKLLPGQSYFDVYQDIVDFRDASLPTDKLVVPDDFCLDSKVTEQLESFVKSIAALYHEHTFNGLERASHATMTCVQLFHRIKEATGETYGIMSDPLIEFSCLFASLIRDVGHPGVTNKQLVREDDPIAIAFKGKSIAEQLSLSIAFDLLLEDQFKVLRQAIYGDQTEMKMFQQIVVNSVLATDSADQELAVQRNSRWQQAFAVSFQDRGTINRKATIVIEHLVQLSDIAYRVQHWELFERYAKRHFIERKIAYLKGREEENPKDFWFDLQNKFFTYHVVPLTKKLDDCGILGSSSSEYLRCAMKNQNEWKLRGAEVLAEMVKEARLYLGITPPKC